MRVLVVDDSEFMRKAITRIVESDPQNTVVGKATNGFDAVELAKTLKPDVITLDVEMPKLDGIEALKRIMAEAPTSVIMCSTMTSKGSMVAIEALSLGAVDFVTKDASHISLKIEDVLKDELLNKIKALGGRVGRKSAPSAPMGQTPTAPVSKLGTPGAVVIGSSTGGPPVLETIIRALPTGMTQPVVIAQHMPAVFTESLATRLNGLCDPPVVHADHSGPLTVGTVHIIQGGKHGRVISSAGGRLGLEIGDNPSDAPYKPSVNELFSSAAHSMGEHCLAVILTGMGDDGLRGARELAKAGAPILAQDAASCVVFGMPKGVVEEGLATAALNPDLIAATLNRTLANRAVAPAPRRMAG